MSTMTVSVPGKLFIAGEYAILFPKQAAILVAIDQFITGSIHATIHDISTIESDFPTLQPLTLEWSHSDSSSLRFNSPTLAAWNPIITAVQVSMDYLSSKGISYTHFHLQIESDLVNQEGKKYGLGSSGAVVVATIKSILSLHGLDKLNLTELFKLTVISLFKSGSQSSMADIAAIIQGGWTYYQAFDRHWLSQQLDSSLPIHQLLNLTWPSLIIEPIDVPLSIQLAIGWTQSPASTDNLVSMWLNQLNDYTDIEPFLASSNRYVAQLKQALIAEDSQSITAIVDQLRQLLTSIAARYQLPIETAELSKLISTANQLGFASKSSGAGGGDCGIAIGRTSQNFTQLYDQWQASGITPLPFKVYND